MMARKCKYCGEEIPDRPVITYIGGKNPYPPYKFCPMCGNRLGGA